MMVKLKLAAALALVATDDQGDGAPRDRRWIWWPGAAGTERLCRPQS